MKKYSLFVAWGLIVFSIFAFTNQATAQNRNTITGFVFDSQRRSIAQVIVEVTNEVNQVLQRTRTDGSGRFFFSGLSAGKFSVRVLPYGTNFEEQTQEVEIVNFVRPGSSTSENAQKDFYLRLRKNAGEGNSITGTLFAQEVPPEAKKNYEKAISSFEQNRVEDGIQELQNALKILPTYYLALERLGVEYIKQQKYENARDVLTRTVAVNPRSFMGWYGLGYANYGLRQPQDAIVAAEKAVSVNSNSTDATVLLGISFRQAKRYNEAEKSLIKAKKISAGKSPDVHWNLALLYAHNLKRYKDAASELELYLKAKPDTANADNIRKLIKKFREQPTQ
ncbi:MAG: tetratricopeptide repeat protein [Acidobacteria bacterium]|nr:tetratricopeptide repeat protein [Acidobacteriota bacterium]MCA1639676.1 tetratricopeptide repeat protein [Acidobacteriota bacterium]